MGINFRRQNLTSKVNTRTVRVKYITVISPQNVLNMLMHTSCFYSTKFIACKFRKQVQDASMQNARVESRSQLYIAGLGQRWILWRKLEPAWGETSWLLGRLEYHSKLCKKSRRVCSLVLLFTWTAAAIKAGRAASQRKRNMPPVFVIQICRIPFQSAQSPSKHEMFTQCWLDVGTASQTVGQHYNSSLSC